MVRHLIFHGRQLALTGMLCLMATFASAQEEAGVVRVTDLPGGAVQNGILPASCDKIACDNTEACAPNACATGNCAPGATACAPGACNNGACNNGACNNGNCRSGKCRNGAAGCGCGCGNGRPCKCNNGAAGACPNNCRNGLCRDGSLCPHCGNGCRGGLLGGLCPFGGANCNGCGVCGGNLSMSVRRIMAWIDPNSGVCSYSPMHGFMPPGKRPYFRQPVSYQHNYPAGWMGGTPSGYHGHRPAVYTPTDTTQLGYYYQKVPTWIPVTGMIPPAPHPNEWHYYGPAMSYAAQENCPAEAAPAAAGEEEAVPPAPMPPIDAVNLERSDANPNLLPIVK